MRLTQQIYIHPKSPTIHCQSVGLIYAVNRVGSHASVVGCIGFLGITDRERAVYIDEIARHLH